MPELGTWLSVCATFLFLWSVGRIILTGFSCFPPQYAVETPGVTIMRQTNRFFFCGHTSGKVTRFCVSSFHKALFHQTCAWDLPFSQSWGYSWGGVGGGTGGMNRVPPQPQCTRLSFSLMVSIVTRYLQGTKINKSSLGGAFQLLASLSAFSVLWLPIT